MNSFNMPSLLHIIPNEMTSIKKPFYPMDDDTTEFKDDESNSDEDGRRFLEIFLKKRKQHQSRKKRTNALILEAQQLINELQHGVPRKLAKKGVSKEVQLVLKIHLGQMPLQRRKKPKTPYRKNYRIPKV